MKTKAMIAGACLLVSAGIGAAQQQQDIEWQQTINIPKGQGVPKGVRADILGIEIGDTYAEAKAKLQKLLAEGLPKAAVEPLRETRTVFRASGVTINYVSMITGGRALQGASERPITEHFILYFSAPSSGHQLYAIQRNVNYPTTQDQPLISDLFESLRQKFRFDPQVRKLASQSEFRFQINDGKPYSPPRNSLICYPWMAQASLNPDEVARINPERDCDLAMVVDMNHGVSSNHARHITFKLGDNIRAKQNLTADFTFFGNYLQNIQNKTRGNAPKL